MSDRVWFVEYAVGNDENHEVLFACESQEAAESACSVMNEALWAELGERRWEQNWACYSVGVLPVLHGPITKTAILTAHANVRNGELEQPPWEHVEYHWGPAGPDRATHVEVSRDVSWSADLWFEHKPVPPNEYPPVPPDHVRVHVSAAGADFEDVRGAFRARLAEVLSGEREARAAR